MQQSEEMDIGSLLDGLENVVLEVAPGEGEERAADEDTYATLTTRFPSTVGMIIPPSSTNHSADLPLQAKIHTPKTCCQCQMDRDYGVPPAKDGTCIVCHEDTQVIPAIWDQGLEQWRKPACGHLFCAGCLTGWIQSLVSQQQSFLPCPHPDCNHRIFAGDVHRIDLAVYDMFVALSARDYAQKKNDLVVDEGLREWVKSNTQECPTCHLIVERESGCDYMICLCGTAFCFQCGQEYGDNGQGSCPCEEEEY
jgi:hypothetical protein